MVPYNPYDERTYNPIQKALSRPLTAPSFNPNTSVTKTPTVSDASVVTPEPPLSSLGASGTMPAGSPAAGAPAAISPAQTPEQALAQWGYTGAIPINNVEQQAIDFVNNLYGTQGPLQTTTNAQNYYNDVLAGKFGPESASYLSAVLDPMRASFMQNYDELSKALATRFSDIGGYYGGRAGIAQGRLASDTARDMASQEAQLRYQNFMDNQSRMAGAAGGLGNLANIQSGLSGDMLNYLLSIGNMITSRDMTNRAQYQQALQNAYNDWVRARSESLMPFAWGQNLIGQEATTPVVTTQQSPWGALLGGVGQGIGAGVSGLLLG